ncbi:MAG: hypothetical protein GPJ54_18895 [Candidatus Heimdallarchaeota archaeon]|nr:hypothetical protein [Candidatus Heimdallarchaeota archaeon]
MKLHYQDESIDLNRIRPNLIDIGITRQYVDKIRWDPGYIKRMNLIKTGSRVLVIQNIVFLFIWTSTLFWVIFNQVDDFIVVFVALIGVFLADMVGFTMLAIGFLKLSRKHSDESKYLRIAGIGILGWVITRLGLQVYLIYYFIIGEGIGQLNVKVFIIFFSISSLCLFISGLSRIHKKYFYFTTMNFVAVWLVTLSFLLQLPGISLELSGLIKLVTLPVLAMFVFMDMYQSDLSIPTSEKYTTDIYPKYQ